MNISCKDNVQIRQGPVSLDKELWQGKFPTVTVVIGNGHDQNVWSRPWEISPWPGKYFRDLVMTTLIRFMSCSWPWPAWCHDLVPDLHDIMSLTLIFMTSCGCSCQSLISLIDFHHQKSILSKLVWCHPSSSTLFPSYLLYFFAFLSNSFWVIHYYCIRHCPWHYN